MGTSVQEQATPASGFTPPAGSLEAATSRIVGLLSDPEDTQPPTTPPTPPKAKNEPTPVAEPEAAAPEEATPEAQAAPDTPAAESPDEDTPQPRTYTVKVDGQNVEVTEDELLKGYSREAHFTRKAQELAQERKRFEDEEVARVRAERHQYQTSLEAMHQAIAAISPKEPDWAERRLQVSPDQLANEVLEWQQHQKTRAAIEAEQTRVKALQDADAQQGFQQHLKREQDALVIALPEMSDPEKAPAIKRDLSTYAKSLGFSDDQLGQVTDHRLVLLLHKAMAYDRAQEKAPKVQNKIDRVLATAAPGNRTPAPKASKLDAAKARLKQTGSVDDGARAIAELL
jgi:hypothetical protein